MNFAVLESMDKALAVLANSEKLQPIQDAWAPSRVGEADPCCVVPISDPGIALSGIVTAFGGAIMFFSL